MNLDTFFARLEDDNRRQPRCHSFGKPLTAELLAQWRFKNRKLVLPADLIALLERYNGFCLYPDGDHLDGVVRFMPLSKWLNRKKLTVRIPTAGVDAIAIPERILALTTDTAGAGYVVFDPDTQRYYRLLAETQALELIADTVEELLDWFDRTWLQSDRAMKKAG